MHRVYFASNNNINEINQLRTQAYKDASGFAVDLETLKWKTADEESFVMVAEAENQLVSTMRGEVINDLSILEQKLECPWSFPIKLNMPILLLSRAGTLASHRLAGLNLVLRYWFLRFAMHHQIQFVIGTFVSGSSRENTLREMGYHFFKNELGWQKSTYRSLQSVNVVVLDLKTHGESALQYCIDHLPERIKEYAFEDEFPNLRYVKGL